MAKKNRNEGPKGQGAAAPAESRFNDYFWANVLFFAFLFILSAVVWQNCQAPSDNEAVQLVLKDTFFFMISLFGGGFLVVTMFDAAYDFFADTAESETPDEPQKGA